MSPTKFSRWVFRIAGIYGLVGLMPPYFMESKMSADYPPAITHPEYYYGFLGVGVAWQIAFLVMSSDPLRYRPLILPAIVEKLSFFIAVVVLHLQGRVPGMILALGIVDLVWAVLFTICWQRLGAIAGQVSSDAQP
jgi:hypothetical protein